MPDKEKLMQDLLTISAPPGTSGPYRALEVTVVLHSQIVPWRFPPAREMQFGEWLRDDIRAGVFELAMVDADLSILLTRARRASVPLFGEPAEMLFNVIPFSDVLQTFRHILEMWQKPADLEGTSVISSLLWHVSGIAWLRVILSLKMRPHPRFCRNYPLSMLICCKQRVRNIWG